MQTFVRRILGFVTQVLGQKAPTTTAVTVDTTEADEAWWENEVYQAKGDWYCEEVPGKCLSCPQPLRLMRWQTSGYGDQCDNCIGLKEKRYEDFLIACEADAEAEIQDAMSVKISL